jgi:peptide/nickel transport system substrate-binding protein
VRNDRYWGGPARLDAVIFRFLKDAAVGPDALGNREVDVLYPQPQLDLLQRLRRIPGATVHATFGLNFELLAFNLRNDFLRDVRVRRAIAKAIDRADLVRRTVGQFQPGAAVLNNRVWLPGQPPYRDHGRLAGYASVDVAGARTLLEDAGFRPDPDGIYVRQGKRLSLTLSTTAGNALREDQAVLIQDQLRAAGIDVRPESIPANVLFGERLPTGNFDMVNASLVGSPFVVGVTAARYASSSNFNVSKYSSPEVDRLLDEAEAEFDGARYAELTNQVDELLWQDLPNLPLYQRPALLAVAEGVENVRDNPWGPGPTWNIHEWAVRRR